MEPESSMRSAREDIPRLAASPDRRPYFCAEALSQCFRLGLLMTALAAATLLFVVVLMISIAPHAMAGLAGALLVGATIALTFLVFLIFGALVGNNARLSSGARTTWYAAFLLAGPLAIPYYWRVHVWPAPLETEHGLGEARSHGHAG